MNIEHLSEILPQDIASRIAQRWARWRQRPNAPGTTTFLASLHQEGVISATQLGDLLGRMDVDITLSPQASPGGRGAPEQPAGGRYELVGLLGQGAMGEVHIARDVLLNRNVAVKTMDPSIAADPGLAARFLVEAQVTAQLDHPSIIPVYALDVDRGRRAYAMKLIRGVTLEEFIEQTRATYEAGRQPDDEHALDARLELFLQVCNAIHYAHERGVVHRDLKPENVMVGAFHEVIVMDWGIAKVLGRPEALLPGQVAEGKGTQTQVGFVVGTPRYMSPEQAEEKNDELGPPSDQYSLGLILYELLALRPAREAPRAVDMIFAAQRNEHRPLQPLSARAPIPRELRAIVARATRLDPAQRYPSVAELADDVRRYLRDEAVLAAPDSTVQRAQRWISHHREKTLLGVFGLVALVLLVGLIGLGGAAGAVEYNRAQAHHREQVLGEFLTLVQSQARLIDNHLLGYQGLLTGLSMSAEEDLDRPAIPVRYYLSDAFHDSARAPDDLLPSKVYDARVSVEHPDLIMAPGLSERAERDTLYRLAGLQPELYRVLLESQNPDAPGLDAKRKAGLIRERGVPLTWAYVATEDGVLVGFPGVGEYPPDYDPREQGWYKMVAGAREVRWSASDLDESGQGLLLTAARGLYARDGKFEGVAGVDVNFGHLVDDLLLPADVPVDVEAWLVDRNGMSAVHSTLEDRATTLKEYTPEPFPHPEILQAATGKELLPHMELEVDGQQVLFAWSKLQAVDYLYVVSAKTRALLR